MARNIKFSVLNYDHAQDRRLHYNREAKGFPTLWKKVKDKTPRLFIMFSGVIASRATLESMTRIKGERVPAAEERSCTLTKIVGTGKNTKRMDNHKSKSQSLRKERRRWHSIRRAARLLTIDKVNEEVVNNMSCCESRIASWLTEWNSVTLPPPPEPTDFWGIGITDAFECVKDMKF